MNLSIRSLLNRLDQAMPLSDEYRHRVRLRGRLVLLVSFGLAALAPVVLIGNLFIGTSWLLAVLLTLLTASAAIPGGILLMTGNANHAGFSLVLVGLICIVSMAWWYGGLKSPISLAIGLLPLMAVAVCDRKRAIIVWLLTAAAIVGLFLSERAGLLPSSLDQQSEGLLLLWLWNHAVFLVISVSIAAFLQSVADHMFAELSEVNQELEIALSAAEAAKQEAERASGNYERIASQRGTFLANMSHEIRTPMNGIAGMVQVLEDTELDARQQEYMAIMSEASKALLVVLDDVLDVLKIESGKISLEEIEFSVGDLVQKVAALLEGEVSKNGNALFVQMRGTLPAQLIGDPTRIRQILYNLISNAAKFTEEGEVTISCGYETGELEISVKDTGIGITPEQQESIFEAFVQADSSTTRKFGGTGLGLSIALNLAQLMGGDLTLQSEPNRGSVFTLKLPLQPPVVSPILRDGTLSRRSSDALNVLVADDDAISQQVIALMLQRLGHNAHIESDGADAISAFEAETFDLVLMDWRMPGIDGLQATARWRELEQAAGRARVPILGLTANVMSGDRDKCLAAGMDDVLPKPITLEALSQAIEKAMAL